MPPVRIGVIGAGWFASRRHCPDILAHPQATLTALCRRDPTQLQHMAAAFQVKHTYTDYRDLVHSGTLETITGGGALDSFTLDTDALGTVRMVSKDTDLRGYDPHSSLTFTNNTINEPYRVRRTHLQYTVIGRHRKQKAGQL